MKNIQKTRDWLHMALKEFDAALADFMDERNSEAIQHAQQCAERVGKSILSFLGFVPEKTHHPSDYIVEEILQHPEVVKKLWLSEDEVKYRRSKNMLKNIELIKINSVVSDTPCYFSKPSTRFSIF
jgi:HEPN domain-containing protein